MEAFKNRDRAALNRILDDQFIFTDAEGQIFNKTQYIDAAIRVIKIESYSHGRYDGSSLWRYRRRSRTLDRKINNRRQRRHRRRQVTPTRLSGGWAGGGSSHHRIPKCLHSK